MPVARRAITSKQKAEDQAEHAVVPPPGGTRWRVLVGLCIETSCGVVATS
jgi:hypothetical protein